MASYWHNLKKPLTNSGLLNTKFYSNSAISNMTPKPTKLSNQGIHVSAKRAYPQAEPLPLPINIDPNESVRFSPQRARDISSTAISTNAWNQRFIDITVDSTYSNDVQSDNSIDPHVNSYDCNGAVSLNSSMQSNVPSPFGGMHKFTHLNMPGGQWSQSNKWMSHDLHSSHYTNLRREVRKNILNDEVKQQNTTSEFSHGDQQGIVVLKDNKTQLHGLLTSKSQSNSAWILFACPNLYTHSHRHFHTKLQPISYRSFCSDKKDAIKKNEPNDESNKKLQCDKDRSINEEKNEVAVTPRAKLKNAIRDYGSTVLIFHIAISLVSLGIFYQLVSSGLDIVAILNYLGFGSTSTAVSSDVASGASTFVVAYAVHKVFAPFRISITLVSAPFIVRFLRNKGFLSIQPPKKP